MQPIESNKGYRATVIFGLVGVLVGGGVGVLTAGFIAPDDLSGLGVALIWLILLGSLGSAGGVAVGLTSRSHARAGLSAVLAAPATFIVSYAGLVLLSRFAGTFAEGWVTALIGWGLQVALVAMALAAVRWISLRMGNPG